MTSTETAKYSEILGGAELLLKNFNNMYGTYQPKGYPKTWADIKKEKASKEEKKMLACGIALVVIMFIAVISN